MIELFCLHIYLCILLDGLSVRENREAIFKESSNIKYHIIMCKTINLNFVNENDVNLLQFCWKHRLAANDNRLTTDGREVEVTDPGLHNRHSDAPTSSMPK